MKVAPNTQRLAPLVSAAAVAAMLLAALWTPVAQAHRPLASRYGGTLSVRTAGPPDCLDPAQTSANVSAYIFEAIADPLITEDQSGKPRPNLAVSWSVSNGDKTFTFHLRHGMRFSNGDPLNAAAVKYTYDRVLNPKTKSPNSSLLGPVKTIRAIGQYTVQIVLSAPFRPLLGGLSTGYLGILDPRVTQQQGLSKSCRFIVGSGPFKIQSVGPAYNPVTLVRNNLHTWGTSWAYNHGRAYLDKLVFKPILSDSTAVSELLTGEVDVSNAPGSQYGRVAHASGIRIYKKLNLGENFLEYNTKKAPLNSVAVRRAIAEAIDRKALVKAALSGLGRPVYSPLAALLPFADPEAAKYAPPYNPTAAAKVLQANHVTGPLTLLVFNNPTTQTAAELIQAELGQVGVRVNIVAKTIADYLPIASKGGFDLNIFDYTYFDADILFLYFHSSQETNGGLNYTFYKSPTFDRLVVAGRETLNAAKARQDYIAAQRFMDRNVVVDPLWTDYSVTAMRSHVGGWHVNLFTGGYTVVPIWQDLYVRK